MVVVVVVLSVAILSVVVTLPEGSASLAWLVDGLAEQLPDSLLYLRIREVNGAIGEDLDPLLLVLGEVALAEQQVPQQVAPRRGAQKIKPLPPAFFVATKPLRL